ncbi:unnamed protein product, partial [Umbelopsis sp. WA50703]
MQNKTLLVLFSVFLISCFAIAVSAFSFGSSENKVVDAQEIVKRGGGGDEDEHKHKHGHDDDNDDEHDDDHGHDDKDNCHESASFLLHGTTYKIPCGTGAVKIDNLCYYGGGGYGNGPDNQGNGPENQPLANPVANQPVANPAANPAANQPVANQPAATPRVANPAVATAPAANRPAGGANVLVTIGTGTGATVSTVSCPTPGPQRVTIGTGATASVTTVT